MHARNAAGETPQALAERAVATHATRARNAEATRTARRNGAGPHFSTLSIRHLKPCVPETGKPHERSHSIPHILQGKSSASLTLLAAVIVYRAALIQNTGSLLPV